MAINWHEKAILLGECKWGTDAVGRDVLRELVEVKTPNVLKDLPNAGESWEVQHALFARAGFTEAARAAAKTTDVLLLDLATLEADL